MLLFKEFPKIARLNRKVIITEKLDGTNAQVAIVKESELLATHLGFVLAVREDLCMLAGSRSRYITPQADNFGFATWVIKNQDELWGLGTGHHYGEWWGQGIQRGYDLTEKRFSLFNVQRWDLGSVPTCCSVVPTIDSGIAFEAVSNALDSLRKTGSYAAPGFMKPEGIVAYHTQGNLSFKVTLEKDEEPKGKLNAKS